MDESEGEESREDDPWGWVEEEDGEESRGNKRERPRQRSSCDSHPVPASFIHRKALPTPPYLSVGMSRPIASVLRCSSGG